MEIVETDDGGNGGKRYIQSLPAGHSLCLPSLSLFFSRRRRRIPAAPSVVRHRPIGCIRIYIWILAATEPTHKLTTNYQSYNIINYNTADVVRVCVSFEFLFSFFGVHNILYTYVYYIRRLLIILLIISSLVTHHARLFTENYFYYLYTYPCAY